MNKVTLLGRFGQDPEFRTIESGANLATFSIATSERWTDRNGEKQERTHWHNCKAWAKTAEVITHYFSKGDQILLEGKLTYEEYTDKDGNKRKATVVVVDRFYFVGSTANTSNGSSEAKQPEPVAADADGPVASDDLPF